MSNVNLPALRSWKWIVGVVFIVLAVILIILGRIDLIHFLLLLGIGVILV